MSAWIEFVQNYRRSHPNMSYKQALVALKGKFKDHKKNLKKHGIRVPKIKKKKKTEDGECPCSKKVQVKKSMRSTIKEQCGICSPKPFSARKRVRKRKKKSTSGSSKAPAEKRAKRKSRLTKNQENLF